MKKTLLITAFVSATLASCASIKGVNNTNPTKLSQPEAIAVDFIQAVYNGNADKAYSFIYIPEEAQPKHVKIAEELIQEIAIAEKKKADTKGGFDSASIQSISDNTEEHSKRVVIESKFKQSNGQPTINIITLLQIGHNWKVRL